MTSRRQLLRGTLLGGLGTLAVGLSLSAASPAAATGSAWGAQAGWRWCRQCESLFYGAVPSNAPCKGNGGGRHDGSGSYNYSLIYTLDGLTDSGVPFRHGGFRWCSKCYCLHAGTAVLSACAAGGIHASAVSHNYHLRDESSFELGQPGWKACQDCATVFYSPRSSTSDCPVGGHHINSSADPAASFYMSHNP